MMTSHTPAWGQSQQSRLPAHVDYCRIAEKSEKSEGAAKLPRRPPRVQNQLITGCTSLICKGLDPSSPNGDYLEVFCGDNCEFISASIMRGPQSFKFLPKTAGRVFV